MLKLVIDADEYFDPETSTFTEVGGFELELEHSLVALSKWESEHKVPFLSNQSKSGEQILSYVEHMIISPIYPDDWKARLSQENIDAIKAYIQSTESATTFAELPGPKSRGETITSELIYYWMVAFQIPFECETWHLNRLFSLIRICNAKNQKPKKMDKKQLAAHYHKLNEQRRKQYNTTG